MPSSLDEDQRAVIVRVISITNVVLMGACWNAQRLVNLSRRSTKLLSTQTSVSSNPTVKILVGCGMTMTLMVAASALLTAMVLWLGNGSSRHDDRNVVSSSINFCEADFVDHPSIAEPANTASSIASYVPLAFLGLYGPPSAVWRATSHRRFAMSYLTLLGIGIGSTLLHATLTAVMQGGDELPMLWFIACLSFVALDVVLTGLRTRSASKTTTIKLQWFFGFSAVVATLLYIFWRSNFLPFLLMFMMYAWITLVCLIMICFVIDWNKYTAFKSNVLLPLGVCTALHAIIGITSWGSEMIFCNEIISQQFSPSTSLWENASSTLLPFFFNRGVHLLWHCSSALLAWMGIQTLIAAKGTQLGWGDAQICWWGAPYVSFRNLKAL
jgi:hypothetical protein